MQRLRNPVGMAFNPQTSELWAVVNERDEIGSGPPSPDYLTSVKDGGWYGWPYSYFGQHVDTRVKPERPELVFKGALSRTMRSATTSRLLAATFAGGDALPEQYLATAPSSGCTVRGIESRTADTR